MMHRDGNITNG